MLAFVRRWTRRALIAMGVLFLLVLGWRAFDAIRSPSLPVWLTHVPPEPDARQIDGYDWKAWLAAEDVAFADVQKNVANLITAEVIESDGDRKSVV